MIPKVASFSSIHPEKIWAVSRDCKTLIIIGNDLNSLSERLIRSNMVSTEVIEKRSTATVRKTAPRYRVLLHNDDFNSMEYVVQCLMQTIAGMTQPQAVDIMMEAHTNGIALVITCALEHAEFYSETLKAHGLSSTIEPDD
jgi:ATP-dependent Clp protease adaptor protein ClpS